MADITQTVQFDAKPEDVYELIMDEKKHAGFTGDSAKVSRDEGGEFSVWGGYAVGKNLELSPGKKIVQTWRATDWPEGIESKVTFIFSPKNDGCELKFHQTGVPDDYKDDIAQGWIDNYWDLMKEYLVK